MSIAQAIEQIDDEREGLMRKALKLGAWQRACDAPGSRWYWFRDWQGKRWTCWSLQDAYNTQRCIDTDPRTKP